MRNMIVINRNRDQILCSQAGYARYFFQRFKGLLGRKSLQPGEGLIIDPCNMVHSLGMRMNIDVLFLNSSHEVIFCLKDMPRNKISPLIREASYVIELPAGLIFKTGTEVGDRLLWQPLCD